MNTADNYMIRSQNPGAWKTKPQNAPPHPTKKQKKKKKKNNNNKKNKKTKQKPKQK